MKPSLQHKLIVVKLYSLCIDPWHNIIFMMQPYISSTIYNLHAIHAFIHAIHDLQRLQRIKTWQNTSPLACSCTFFRKGGRDVQGLKIQEVGSRNIKRINMQQVFKSFYSLIDEGSCHKRTVFLRFKCENIGPISPSIKW